MAKKETSQELKAFNQQLVAVKKQLAATEQQLRAANQKLVANEKEQIKSHLFADQIANATPALMYLYDLKQGKNIWTNDAYKDYFERLTSTYPGMDYNNIAEFIHEDDFREIVNKTLQLNDNPGMNDFSLDIRIKTTDDEWKWMLLRVSSFSRDKEGKLLQTIGALFDITDRKNTNDQLLLLNRFFSDLVSINDPQEVYDYFTESIHSIYPRSIILYTSVDEAQNDTRLESISGIDNSFISKIKDIAGFNPLGRHYHLTAEHKKIFCKTKLHLYNGGLAEFSANGFPTAAARIIEKLFKINKIYTIGLSKDNNLIGAVHVFTLNDFEIEDGVFIETYTAYFSSIIQNLNSNFKLSESELKYRNLFENLVEEVHLWRIIKHKNGKIKTWELVDANPSALKSWNKTKEQVIGKTPNDIFGYDATKQFMPIVKKIVATGKPHSWEEYFAPTNQNLSMTSISMGEYFISTGKDITEKKQAENALKISESRLKEAQSVAKIGSWDMDPQTGKGFWSDELFILFGYKPQDKKATYQLFREHIHTDDIHLFEESLEEYTKKVKAVDVEFRYYTVSGELRNAYSKGIVDFDSEGNPIRAYGTFQDITEDKEQAKVLEEINRRYQTIVKNFPNGAVFLFDKNMKYIHVEGKALSEEGLDPTEMIGKTVKDVFPAEVSDVAYKNQMILLSSKNCYFEVKFAGRTYANWGEPIVNNKNEIEEGVIFAVDITEQKNAEERINKAERYFRALVENATDGITINDIEGRIVYASPNALRQFGFTEEDIAKKPHGSEFTHPDDLVVIKETLDKVIQNPDYRPTLQYRFRTKDGEYRWIETTFTNLLNDPVVNGFVLNFKDISERKKVEQEIILAKEKAEESDRLKSAFLANMSHEIRTPMNGILGFMNLLKEPDLSGEEQENFIDIIQKSGERLMNTVNDIIEISRIEVGDLNINTKNVNINGKISDIISFFMREAKSKGLDLEMDLPLGKQYEIIETDESKIESIITNLIKNAIKYSDSGTITFGYEVYGDKLKFYCKDEGIGIPDHRQEAIFNRFEQADIEDTRVFEGSGLGLAITKAYVEILGGLIWVESSEGKGSKFYFTLPIQEQENHNARIAKKPEIISSSNDKPNRKLKILIVEDDETSALHLQIILANKSEKLYRAKTGEEAIEKIKTHTDIDLILMDIKLPLMDGYEVTRKIREFNNEVKIIAQTAYSFEIDRKKAMETGCNDYIAKPLDKEKLLKIINMHLD